MYKLLAKQAVLRQFFQPLTTVNKNVHVDVRFIVFWSVSQKQPLLNSDKRNIRTVCPNTIYSTWKQSLRVTDVYTNITTIFFYCCTVHFDNIKILFTNKCTLLLNIQNVKMYN